MDDATHGRGVRAEARIAGLCADQHGVFSRRQALEAGFTTGMIRSRLELHRWTPADYGVYRPSTTPPSWELTLMAACLGGPAVGSHRAAARLWNAPGFQRAAPEVTAYRHRRRHSGRVCWHESRFLDERRDTTTVDGIPVTTPTRTIVDLSRVASVVDLEIALDDACHRGLTTYARVAAEVDRLGRWYGTRRIRTVLGLKTGDIAPAESPLETRVAIMLREAGLPAPEPQHQVFDGATFVGRVDFAWPDRRVVLEVDGFSWHADRAAWEHDLDRRSRLAAAGWLVFHVTHRQLRSPQGLLEKLQRAVGVP